jgi:hypothetical protein
VVALALAGGLGNPANADPVGDRVRALESSLARSLKLIEKLSARVDELERAAQGVRASTATAANDPADKSTEAIANLQADVDQIARGLSHHQVDQGLPLHGFADVGAAWNTNGAPARLNGFGVGALDVYLTPQITERLKGLVELVFEYEPDGGGAIDLERLQLGYVQSDQLTFWLGRFHTPFGAWNTLYHHGANLQTAITRPRFLDFEDRGGIIPAHTVGAWASGRAPLGRGRATYEFYLGNGPKISDRHLNFNAFTDDNADKMVGANIGYEFAGPLAGLTLGAHGFGMKVDSYSDSGLRLGRNRVRVFGGYGVFDDGAWEAIAEYYRFSNAEEGGAGRVSSQAGFVQAGRTFGQLTPYLRFERAALAPMDTFFQRQRSAVSYRRAVVGLRYALGGKGALKFELSHSRDASGLKLDEAGLIEPLQPRRYQQAAIQYSIAF